MCLHGTNVQAERISHVQQQVETAARQRGACSRGLTSTAVVPSQPLLYNIDCRCRAPAYAPLRSPDLRNLGSDSNRLKRMSSVWATAVQRARSVHHNTPPDTKRILLVPLTFRSVAGGPALSSSFGLLDSRSSVTTTPVPHSDPPHRTPSKTTTIS